MHATDAAAAVTPAPLKPLEGPTQDATPVSSKAKLELLQQLERRSQAAMRDLDTQSQAAPPRMIDARMYNAAVKVQRKISEKLSEANSYIDVLEEKLEGYDDDLDAAADIFKKVSMEFGTTSRLADAAVAAVKFGVDPQDAVAKITNLKERLDALEKAMKKEREMFAKRVPRKVPITWVGAASEVRLVGDFDKWSRGIDLSNPDVESDSVMRTFEGTINLLPGKYRVKFLVDNEWRLAPEWPMENDEKGETNNVLEVK